MLYDSAATLARTSLLAGALSLPLCLWIGCADDSGPPGAAFQANCVTPTPSSDATALAAPHDKTGNTPAGWIQPGGRDLLPVGTLIPIGGFPLAIRNLPPPYDRYVVTSNAGYGDNSLVIVDTQVGPAGQGVVAQVPYPAGDQTPQSPALFYGLQVGRKFGVRIFASGGGYDIGSPDGNVPGQHNHVVDVYALTGSAPHLVLTKSGRVVIPAGPAGMRYPAGIYLSSDETRLYVAGQADGSLSIWNVDPKDPGYGKAIGSIEELGSYPYDVAVDEARQRAYVSLWGGDGLVAVDVADPAKPVQVQDPQVNMLLKTGKSTEQLLIDPGPKGQRLYAVATDADRVTALSLDGMAMPTVDDFTRQTGGLAGAAPNGLALDTAKNRLYVANAYDNSISVLNLADLTPIGRFPTAAYPTGVTVMPDGSIVVLCAKGIGIYPKDRPHGDGNPFEGTLHVIPADEDPVRGDAQVALANGRRKAYEPLPTCSNAQGEPRRFPLPQQPGDQTPIKYVFLIVKENKTYDALLGDLGTGRGHPELVLFGEQNTPNLHALARAFTSLDNFYANADASIQGHEWTTAALSNDLTEKAWFTTWGRGSRPESMFGGSVSVDYSTTGQSGSMFQELDRAGVSYHNYGEIVNSSSAQVKFDPSYPGVLFNLDETDKNRADYLVSLLNDPTVTLERFHYILFPRDHTYGTSPGKETPQSMVADNDEGLGRFIDGLSHSSYWSQSIVFVIEDDPSDGADHVDQHRSICLAISPWVKRGYISGVNQDDPSLWQTLSLLLGVPPHNTLVSTSAGMYDLFTTEPDFTPYTAIPRKMPTAINAMDAPLAAESMAIDFSKPDTAPLGRILWRAVRGEEPPFGASRRLGPPDDDD